MSISKETYRVSNFHALTELIGAAYGDVCTVTSEKRQYVMLRGKGWQPLNGIGEADDKDTAPARMRLLVREIAESAARRAQTHMSAQDAAETAFEVSRDQFEALIVELVNGEDGEP